MASYLTPEWLMSDLNQLTSQAWRPVPEDEFWGSSASYELYKQAIDEGRLSVEQIREFGAMSDWGPGGASGVGYTLLDILGQDELANKYSPSSIFDREGFVGDIAGYKDVSDIDPTAYTEFTPGMFKKLRTEHYQPQIEEGRGTLLSQLSERQRMASARGGALAGYGGRERAGEVAQQGYYRGMEDIYTGIEQEKAAGLQSIYDVLSQYETIGEE